MKTVFQTITVSSAFGFKSLIPNPFCFTNFDAAYENVRHQLDVFEANDEPCYYRGQISTLSEIANLCKADVNDFEAISNDIYILELEVRDE